MQQFWVTLDARDRSPYVLWLAWMLWLPFLVPPVVHLVQAHPAEPRLTLTLLGATLFASLYAWASWHIAHDLVVANGLPTSTMMARWLVIAAMCALSISISLGNGKDWYGLFIFTAAYIGGSLPPIRAGQAFAGLAVLIIIVGRLQHASWFDIGQGFTFTTIVGFVVISFVRSTMTNRELRAAREEIARLAVQAERLRIARDLHDLLGHNLALIALKSELAKRLLAVAPERAEVEIGDVEQVARTTLQEVREAVGGYRQPTIFHELHAAQELLEAAGIAYHAATDEQLLHALPTPVEAVLAWTVREGVTNVIRHSRAQQCRIQVTGDAQQVAVEIVDDGIEQAVMDTTEVIIPLSKSGNGLRGLAERVAALGGSCEATANAHGGFRLAVALPLAERSVR